MQADAPQDQTSTNKKTILIVEDEPDARQIFLDVLEEAGFVVVGAAGGNEALDKLEKGKFDLVLLDIVMPDKDGISVLTEIKKFSGKYGANKIVMLTNIGGDLAIEKAMSIGAEGYLLKSETDPDTLIVSVRRYLNIVV